MCTIVRGAIFQRPPISLFLVVLVLCALFLSGALIRLRIVDSIVDPSMESNSTKLLTTLTSLDFCSEPWNQSSRLYAINEAFFLDLSKYDHAKKQLEYSFQVELLYTGETNGNSFPIFSEMRGHYLGFTGADALVKVNVTLLVPGSENQAPCRSERCAPQKLMSCMVLSAPTEMLPNFRLKKSCLPNQMNRIQSTKSAKMLWHNQKQIVGANRCKDHVIWKLNFAINSLMSTISQDDIDLICVRITGIISVLVFIIFSISTYVVCMAWRSDDRSSSAYAYSPLTNDDQTPNSLTSDDDVWLMPSDSRGEEYCPMEKLRPGKKIPEVIAD